MHTVAQSTKLPKELLHLVSTPKSSMYISYDTLAIDIMQLVSSTVKNDIKENKMHVMTYKRTRKELRHPTKDKMLSITSKIMYSQI